MRNLRDCVLVGIIALLSVVVSAQGQAKHQPSAPPTVKPNIERIGNGAGFNTSSSPITLSFSLGWNYVHTANCTMYNNNGYNILVAYPVEGGYFYTYGSDYMHVMEPSCQSGNWIAFYVTDNAGDWNQVWTYTYK